MIPDDPRFPDLDKLPKLGWKPEDDGPVEELPEGFATVRFLSGQQNPAPKIRWGKHFNPETPETCPECDGTSNVISNVCHFCGGTGKHPLWRSLEWKSERYRKVAEAMNHAAEHAQNMLRENIAIAVHQEKLLHEHVAHNERVDEIMQSMIDETNSNLQRKDEEILQLRAYIRAERAESVEHAMALLDAGLLPGDHYMSWDIVDGKPRPGAKTLDERLDKQNEEAA